MKRGVLIGAGYFAPYHLDAWARIDGAEIVGLADLDAAQISRLDPDRTIQRYTDAVAMLDDLRPDFVDIVTPPATHRELALAAAARGIHVICQKPVAPTTDEAVDLIQEMAASSARFMVHENWRWQPWYRVIKSALDDGTTGTPFNATFTLRTGDGWQSDAYLQRQPYFREYPRLLIFETGVHVIDTFRYLFGEVQSVYAQLRQRNGEIAGEDAGVCVFTFASGAIASLDASRYNESMAKMPRYTFGTMRLDAARGHVLLDDDGTVSWKALGEPAHDLLADPSTQGFAGDSVMATQQHFLDQLTTGEPFESSGQDYLRTVAVVEACYESARTNQVVHLGHTDASVPQRLLEFFKDP